MAVKNRKKMNVRLILPAILVILVAAASIGGTFAYFTATQNKVNAVSTIGEDKIVIDEDFPEPESLNKGENVFKKAVRVKNIGTIDCYVRVRVTFSDKDIEKISQVTCDGSTWEDATVFCNSLPSSWSHDDWVFENGFFYYTKPLGIDKYTPYLTQSIKTTFPDEASIKGFSVDVYAESVNTKNFNGIESEDYREAWGLD